MYEIIERYESTGLAKRYRMNGLEFEWTDWVICKVSFVKGNPIHWCIASSFRDSGEKSLFATLLNPTYDEMMEFRDVAKLNHFEPVQVIEKVRERA